MANGQIYMSNKMKSRISMLNVGAQSVDISEFYDEIKKICESRKLCVVDEFGAASFSTTAVTGFIKYGDESTYAIKFSTGEREFAIQAVNGLAFVDVLNIIE